RYGGNRFVARAPRYGFIRRVVRRYRCREGYLCALFYRCGCFIESYTRNDYRVFVVGGFGSHCVAAHVALAVGIAVGMSGITVGFAAVFTRAFVPVSVFVARPFGGPG